MHISLRRFIFAFFVLAFVISAPLVVLYTAGYRLNISNRRLQQTGVLAVTTYPRGSTIILNGQGLNAKSPYIVQRIMPNTHSLTLQKKGYRIWDQNVHVEEGKTTYVTVRLFAESQPQELGTTETALALRAKPATLAENGDTASVALINNGSNIEVRAGITSDAHLVGLLPLGTYETLVEGNDYVILRDERNTAYVIARQGGAVVKLPTQLTAFDWLERTDSLLWTDGTEVNIYSAITGEKTFITREGQSVHDVAWHPEADSFFVVNGSTLSAYDVATYETREITQLLTETAISDIWVDAAGKNLYFTEGASTFKLPLVL